MNAGTRTGGSVAEQLAAVEPLVRGICRSRLGAADGDDAAQRTMLTLWRRLDAIAAGDRPWIESLHGYAAVCARYESVKSLREFVDRPTVAFGDLTEWARADETPGPEARAARAAEVADATARVEQLLVELSPREVAVLRATKLAATEPDTATAARELGVTASSVRSVQVRAMARLRALCGTRSTNPLASQTPRLNRETASRTAAQAHRAEQQARRAAGQREFGDTLRSARLARGLTQAEVAAAVGCGDEYVSKLERGQKWPSADLARRADAALDAGETLQHCRTRHLDPTNTHDRDADDRGADDRGAGDGRVPMVDDPGQVGDGTDDDSLAAGAACAEARTAVRAVVEQAEQAERVAGEQARTEQLTCWHADDQATAAGDGAADERTADADDEMAWSA